MLNLAPENPQYKETVDRLTRQSEGPEPQLNFDQLAQQLPKLPPAAQTGEPIIEPGPGLASDEGTTTTMGGTQGPIPDPDNQITTTAGAGAEPEHLLPPAPRRPDAS